MADVECRDGDRKFSKYQRRRIRGISTKAAMAATEERPWTVGRSVFKRRQLWGITPHLRVDLCMWPDLLQGSSKLNTQQASLVQQPDQPDVPKGPSASDATLAHWHSSASPRFAALSLPTEAQQTA